MFAVIQSFGDRATARLFQGELPRGMGVDLARRARRRLVWVDVAETLSDLRVPPGNRLEALKGDLDGSHSIRINRQWRVVFVWGEDGPEHVRIIDYH
ncbi:type II toxin-antitoxin system RelE/ParE family toxin [Gordonia sp. FQ]|uniref:type II toxin-antitoxin system RelE/ParE family toxin n=1 Tax=Gordonia sp. FQ TaxID=3446634 RepID=UPI003F86F0B1